MAFSLRGAVDEWVWHLRTSSGHACNYVGEITLIFAMKDTAEIGPLLNN